MHVLAALDPLLDGDLDLRASSLHRRCSRSSSFFVDRCSSATMFMVWFERKVIAGHAEPHRPEQGRPVRASCRPSPTASSCSSRKTCSPTGPTASCSASRRTSSFVPGVPRVRGHPARRRLQRRQRRHRRRSSATTRCLQLADPPIGILLVLAMSSIAVYGIMLAGWSSGSKYPLLGSVRASAQMVSYEAALGLSVAAVAARRAARCRHQRHRRRAGRPRRTGTSSPPASCRSSSS